MASCSKPYTSILLVLLLSLGLGHSHTASSIIIKGACKPQGLLLLDKPYPPPTRVELPFCQQVCCSGTLGRFNIDISDLPWALLCNNHCLCCCWVCACSMVAAAAMPVTPSPCSVRHG